MLWSIIITTILKRNLHRLGAMTWYVFKSMAILTSLWIIRGIPMLRLEPLTAYQTHPCVNQNIRTDFDTNYRKHNRMRVAMLHSFRMLTSKAY